MKKEVLKGTVSYDETKDKWLMKKEDGRIIDFSEMAYALATYFKEWENVFGEGEEIAISLEAKEKKEEIFSEFKNKKIKSEILNRKYKDLLDEPEYFVNYKGMIVLKTIDTGIYYRIYIGYESVEEICEIISFSKDNVGNGKKLKDILEEITF